MSFINNILIICGGISHKHINAIAAARKVTRFLLDNQSSFNVVAMTRSKNMYLLNHSDVGIFKEFNDMNMLNCGRVDLIVGGKFSIFYNDREINYDIVLPIIPQCDESMVMLYSSMEAANIRYLGARTKDFFIMQNRRISKLIMRDLEIRTLPYLFIDLNDRCEYNEISSIMGKNLLVKGELVDVWEDIYYISCMEEFELVKKTMALNTNIAYIEEKKEGRELDVIIHYSNSKVNVVHVSEIKSSITKLCSNNKITEIAPYTFISINANENKKVMFQIYEAIEKLYIYHSFDLVQIRFFVDNYDTVYLLDILLPDLYDDRFFINKGSTCLMKKVMSGLLRKGRSNSEEYSWQNSVPN